MQAEQQKRFLMPLSDYNRIYQVAHGVLKDVRNAEKSCIFFAIFGAYVLSKQFRIPAQAVAGAFALCVGGPHDRVLYGDNERGVFGGSEDGFHMWVQTDTHIIDFMAPIYREAVADTNPTFEIPRKMFQRPLASEVGDFEAVSAPGAFRAYANPDITTKIIDDFFARDESTDLIKVAEAWYGTRRGKQKPNCAMKSDRGEVFDLRLPATVALGSW